jgi:hypothetical protein
MGGKVNNFIPNTCKFTSVGCISNCRSILKNIYLCAFQNIKKINIMTREEFLSLADSYYSDFESLKDEPTFYEYEKKLGEVVQKLSCDFMEKQLNEGSVTHNRRKKKL